MRKTSLRRALGVGCIIVVFLIVLVLAYLFIFQKIFGNPFRPGGDYEGIEYYESGAYLEFEKGDLLIDTFSSYAFAEFCEIKDFYYIDNCTQDSIIYGICPDVYAITLDAGDHYEVIKTEIVERGSYIGEIMSRNDVGNADCYVMPLQSDTSTDWFIFCVGQEREFLRFILMTDYIETEADSPRETMFIYSRMDWTFE